MKSKVYFGPNGLTSTSANYICNIAKEYYKQFETALQNTKFYDTSVSLIGGSSSMIIDAGTTSAVLYKMPEALKKIAECKSLIAWLREGIKAKEDLKKAVERVTIQEWADEHGYVLPAQPVMAPVLTEEGYYATLPIKEMNRYYYLETLCAEIGKFIHENGVLNRAKEDLVKKMHAPYSTSGVGRDMTVTKYEPTCDYGDVETIYFSLQDEHRAYQAQLNAMKFECEKEIHRSESYARVQYTLECDQYANEMRTLQAQFKEWKLAAETEVQDLKIIIPAQLTNTYNQIKSLGKK